MKLNLIKLNMLIIISMIFFTYCAADKDFTEMIENPSLIASMNNPDDDPEDSSFGDEAILSSQTPTFVWSEIKGAKNYEIRIWDDGRKESYIYRTEDNSTTFTIPSDEKNLKYSYVDSEKNFTPYIWEIRGMNNFQYMPCDETRKFYIKNGIPPETEITAPNTNTVVTDNFDITIASTDDLGLDTIEISIDGGEYIVVWQRTEDDFEVTERSDVYPITYANLTFGAHTICVKATDLHGNTTLIDNNLPADDCITVIKLPPAPTLCADNLDTCDTTPTLCWNAVDGASSYEIDLATDSGFANTVFSNVSVSSTTYTTDVLNNTTYYWRVRTVYKDTSGTEYKSDSYTAGDFTIYRPTLVTPTGLSGPGDGCVNGTFTFSWATATDHSYNVQYSSDGATWTDATIAGGTASTVLSTAGTYTWRVQSVTICNDTSSWVTSPSFAVKAIIPPSGLSGPTSACQGSNFTFNFTTTAEHTYTFEYSAVSPENWMTLQSGYTSSTYSTTAFSPGTYKWRIMSNHVCGGSSWVDGSTFEVWYNPIAPTSLNDPADACENQNYTLTWGSAAGNTYTIEFNKDGGGWSPLVSGLASSPYSYAFSSAGTYQWRVTSNTAHCGSSTPVVATNTFTVNPSPIVPVVTAYPANACASSGFNFGWTVEANHTYELEYAPNASSTYTVLTTGYTNPQPYTTVINIPDSYKWRIRSNSNLGCSSSVWNYISTTFDVYKNPAIPTIVSGPSNLCVNSTNFTFTWNTNAGATYIIQTSPTSTTSWTNLTTGQSGPSYNGTFAVADTYKWKIQEVTANCGNSIWTESGTPFTVYPSAANPAGLDDPNDGCKNANMDFNWTFVTNNTYEIEYSPTATTSWTSLTTGFAGPIPYTTTFATANTYKWRIKSTSTQGCGTSNWVEDPQTYVVQDATLPSGLTNPTSGCASATGSFTFSWTATGGHTYAIEYALSTSASYSSLSTNATSPFVDNSTFTTSGTYKWRIKSTLTACSVDSAWVDGGTWDVVQKPTLTAVSPDPNTNGLPQFNWNNCGTGVTYDVYCDTNATPVTTITTGVAGTTFTKTAPALANNTYKWKVRAKLGSSYCDSDISTFVVNTCTAISGISGLNVSDTCEGDNINMSWSSIANSDHIYVKISTDGAVDGNGKFTTPFHTSADLKGTTPTSYTTSFTWAPSGSAPWSAVYYWQVNATNSCSDVTQSGANINLYRKPVGPIPTAVDPPNNAILFQHVKPSFYWTTTGISGQTGYSLEASENTGYAPKLASTPENVSTNEFTNGLTNKLYTTVPNVTKTVYWHVRAYNTLPQCSGNWSSDVSFKIRFGDASFGGCVNLDTGYYAGMGEQPIGITYVPGSPNKFFVGVHSSVGVGQHPDIDAMVPIPYVDVYDDSGGWITTAMSGSLIAEGCEYIGDIHYYAGTNRLYVSCNVYPTSGDSKILVFDPSTYALITTFTLNGTSYPAGISIGNDGSDRFYIADRDVYDYPLSDVPLKRYAITGGAVSSTYTINWVNSVAYNQYGIWGVNFDPGLNIVSCTTREQNGASIEHRGVQTFDATTGAFKYFWEYPPAPLSNGSSFYGNWGLSKTFGPPIPSGPSYGPVPNGRYVLLAADDSASNGWGVVFEVTGTRAKYVGAVGCPMAYGVSGIAINPDSYDVWVTTATLKLVGMVATIP